MSQKNDNSLTLYDKYIDSHLHKANRLNSAEHGINRKTSIARSHSYLTNEKRKDLTRNVRSEAPANQNTRKDSYSKHKIPNYVK